MQLTPSKFKAAVLLLLVFSTVAAAQDEQLPAPWAKFENEGAGFSVLMPGKPVETITKRPKYTMHSFTVTLGRSVFSVSYSDYIPEVKLDDSSVSSNIEKFNKNLSATLLTKREMKSDGQSGVEFTAETPALNVKSRVFVIGNRMFQTAALVFKDVDDTISVNRFFDSFKFTTTKGSVVFVGPFSACLCDSGVKTRPTHKPRRREGPQSVAEGN
ncbi:MAG TPA: hypothetical protein VFS76_05460 [Pyrinomonadaceae bacterium]|nr:hypothetical protein [Pyrinomonadaceae bacterium]